MNEFKTKAQEILCIHTEAFMKGCSVNGMLSAEEMYDSMTAECSFIVTNMLIEGEITIAEYFHVRNELGALLYKIFSREQA